jgi:hypothetical protein
MSPLLWWSELVLLGHGWQADSRGKGRIMIKALSGCLFVALVMVGPRAATALSYFDISSDVTLTQTAVNGNFILNSTDPSPYRVIEVSASAQNSGTSTYTDVKMVLPFAWVQKNSAGQGTAFAYSWVDANGQWESNAVTGLDGSGGVFAKPVDGGDFAAITLSAALGTMLMSDTDLALSDSWKSPTAYVLSTDDVPAWDIAATLAPSQTVNFKFYIQVERDAQIYSFWTNGSPVAIPEPGTASLLILGLAGLAAAGRRRA